MFTAFRRAVFARSPVAVAVQSALDAMFDNVALLLKGDGADGSVIVDEKGATILGASSSTLSTLQSKFGGSSLNMNGEKVSVAYRPEYQLNSDFTVEFWMYPRSYPSVDGKLVMRHTSGVYPTYGLWWRPDGRLTAAFGNGVNGSTTGYVGFTSVPVALNEWTHVVQQVRNGQCEMYINGVFQGTYPRGQVDASTTLPLVIAEGFNGFLDDVRVTKGYARYAGAFTPPGAAAKVGVDPYWDRVPLLLHFDGASGSTTFTDEKGHTVTRIGNPAPVITSTNGRTNFGSRSGDFRVLGQGLRIAHAPDLSLGGNSFTLEGHIWLPAVGWEAIGHYYTLMQKGSIGSNLEYRAALTVPNTGSLQLEFLHGGAAGTGMSSFTSPSFATPAAAGWHHWAIVREGTNLLFYWDGVRIGTVTTSDRLSLFQGTADLTIGCDASGSNSVRVAMLDEFRITKAVRYPAAFTPPTNAFAHEGTNSATRLLLHCDGDNPGDSSPLIKPAIRTTNVTTATDSKFGSHCLVFTGVINQNVTVTHPDIALGDSDFTFEWFMKSTTAPGGNPNAQIMFLENISGSTYGGLIVSTTGIHISTTGAAWQITSALLPLNFSADGNWHHIAIVRQGTKVMLFMDGVKTREVAGLTGAIYPRHPNRLTIGDASGSYPNYPCKIDEVRLSSVARYTANFTPPSAPFTA